MQTVKSADEIVRNVLIFHGYKDSPREEERNFYSDRRGLGKNFVWLRIDGQDMFGPSRFVGYRDNTMIKHLAFEGKHGGETSKLIRRVLTKEDLAD